MKPPPSALALLLAALAAGALAFALAAGGFALTGGLFEGWAFLACFAAVPAAVIALLPFSARIFSFGLSLLAIGGTWLLDLRGPDNPMIVLPLIAYGVAGGAIVAELCVRAVRGLPGTQSTVS